MPDVIILDSGFQPMLPIVDVYSSLQWTRKYYECGGFELHAPIAFCELLKGGSYVYRSDARETGMIEEFGYSMEDGGSESVFVKGRFLNALFENRVVEKQTTIKENAEIVLRTLVNAYAINPADPLRKIDKLVLGNIAGVGGNVKVQIAGDPLMEYFDRLCLEQELSWLLRFDFNRDKLVFDVWKGLNRTDGQTENNLAVFSREMENLSAESYKRSSEGFKNFAYVVGGDDENPITEQVSIQTAGEDRREMLVDAGNIKQKDDNGNVISEVDYRALLRQRGLEKLQESCVAESVDTTIHPYGNLEYKKDFDLGDLCIVRNTRIGYQTVQRITEVKEVYENGCTQIDAVFGTEKMTIKQYIDRRFKNG